MTVPSLQTFAQIGFAESLLLGGGGVALGIVLAMVIYRFVLGRTISHARAEAGQIIRTAESEAEASRQRIELEGEKKLAARREEFDKEVAESTAEIRQTQARVAKREDTLDRRLEQIADRESRLDDRENNLQSLTQRIEDDRKEIDATKSQLRERLLSATDLSSEKAREIVLGEVREEAEHESAQITQMIIDEAEENARSRSREITMMAIQRYAAEHVVDTTVRTIKIPSDDMKGRVIGREGRNIRTLERVTGADIMVDDTPGVISVSCFDPIRRAVASEALQTLVADGRVHPARIEEVVEKVQTDMNERINKHGKDAVVEANIRGLHPKIVEAMGRLAFRTSYGQNVLKHSLEVAYLSQLIADQLDLNSAIARRAGFLHDIGKSMDHEMEGGHPAIGMEFVRKFRENSEEVLNAIGGHHGDIAATTPYTAVVMAADALSGARPGARRESMEMYIKRLEHLEKIARSQNHVVDAHAIQAGREIRVIVDAKKADDAHAFKISREIAQVVEQEMTFPGEIKVTVLREVRAEAVAR